MAWATSREPWAKGAIEPTIFNAGPSVIEAMFAGQPDLAHIGPNPAINGYVQEPGEALRIAGAPVPAPCWSSGLSAGSDGLKIYPACGLPAATWQYAGRRLRVYLRDHDLSPAEQGGTVEVADGGTRDPDLLRLGDRRAWVPEPWASRLIIEWRRRALPG
jgi:NitT/TauT family transport system substrate-binding protein